MSTTTGFYYEFLFLSTPSARRATHHHCYVPPRHWISIHALREEGDANSKYKVLGDMQISIHALREEGDTVFRAASMRGLDFYPRPPRGGRLAERSGIDFEVVFLSTPSARRATSAHFLVRCSHLFLSTPSARRATGRCARHVAAQVFLSTPSARRATR